MGDELQGLLLFRCITGGYFCSEPRTFLSKEFTFNKLLRIGGMKTWKLVCKISKVVLLMHHAGPPLPVWGSPGKPQTLITLWTETYFPKLAAGIPKYIHHAAPRKRVGAGSLGLPIAPPQCKKGLCATGAEEWRQVPGVGRAPSSVCSGISYYLLSRSRRSSCLHHHGNRQSVWVEGGVKLGSFLSDNLQRAGLAQTAA